MRLLIGAFGTRGDVQPMAALARTLLARGHAVDLAVPPSLLAFVRGLGLPAVGVGFDVKELTDRLTHGTARELIGSLPLFRAEIEAQLQALDALAASADVITGCSLFLVGQVLSELHHRPYAYFGFAPQVFPSADHAPPMFKTQRSPRWFNRLAWAASGAILDVAFKSVLDRARGLRGLPPEPEPLRALMGPNPVLSSDPQLSVAPADAGVPIAQVGALFLDDETPLSPEAEQFLRAGAPPVYLGFGSMSDPHPERTTARVLDSVHRAGVRALVSRGWADLRAADVPSGVLFVGAEPHGRLFPRCAAVVHHGGAGTTHAAARAGVPQVVMPQMFDQHFWADRVQTLGIGPPPVKRHGSAPEPLARALRACLAEPALRERAQAVGRAMLTDGPRRAAELLERLGPPSR